MCVGVCVCVCVCIWKLWILKLELLSGTLGSPAGFYMFPQQSITLTKDLQLFFAVNISV